MFIKLTKFATRRGANHLTNGRDIYINMALVSSIEAFEANTLTYPYGPDEKAPPGGFPQPVRGKEMATSISYAAAMGEDQVSDLVQETPEDIIRRWMKLTQKSEY